MLMQKPNTRHNRRNHMKPTGRQDLRETDRERRPKTDGGWWDPRGAGAEGDPRPLPTFPHLHPVCSFGVMGLWAGEGRRGFTFPGGRDTAHSPAKGETHTHIHTVLLGHGAHQAIAPGQGCNELLIALSSTVQSSKVSPQLVCFQVPGALAEEVCLCPWDLTNVPPPSPPQAGQDHKGPRSYFTSWLICRSRRWRLSSSCSMGLSSGNS